MKSVTEIANIKSFLREHVKQFSLRKVKAVFTFNFRDILLTISLEVFNSLMSYWDTKYPGNSESQRTLFPKIFVFMPLRPLTSFSSLWESVHDSLLGRWNKICTFLPNCNSAQRAFLHQFCSSCEVDKLN